MLFDFKRFVEARSYVECSGNEIAIYFSKEEFSTLEEESGILKCYFNKGDRRALYLGEDDCVRRILNITSLDKFILSRVGMRFAASESGFTWLAPMSNGVVKPILGIVDYPKYYATGHYAQLNVYGLSTFTNIFA